MWGELRGKRRKQVVGALGVIGFLVLGWVASFVLPSEEEANQRRASPATPPLAPQTAAVGSPSEAGNARMETPAPAPTWYVYITGSVRKPGVYQLPPGSRLFQLVDAAGGFDGFADRVAVNLAAPLADGLHVHVPRKGETAGRSASTNEFLMSSIAVQPGPNPSPGFQVPGTQVGWRGDGRIDINRAPADELTRLRGIGPSLAQRIVEHRRQHGPFRSVEDLVQVRGIGAAKIRGLRDQAVTGP